MMIQKEHNGKFDLKALRIRGVFVFHFITPIWLGRSFMVTPFWLHFVEN
jgi:hypothetical protein